jgi:putative addiction module killer protein
MVEVIQSSTFATWLAGLKDRQARARIHARIDRMADGNFGDAEPVGEGVSEARIHYGPGYRLYFMQRGQMLVVLLCGGDKSTQQKDIRKAKLIAQTWEEKCNDTD